MGQEEWLTPTQAAKWIVRSRHTIYTWIKQTRANETDTPLNIKHKIRSDGQPSRYWLIEASSLVEMDAKSPRNRATNRFLKESNGGGKDSFHYIKSDRKKWVEGWVRQGKSLGRVRDVFHSDLHPEIEEYYEQAIFKQGDG